MNQVAITVSIVSIFVMLLALMSHVKEKEMYISEQVLMNQPRDLKILQINDAIIEPNDAYDVLDGDLFSAKYLVGFPLRLIGVFPDETYKCIVIHGIASGDNTGKARFVPPTLIKNMPNISKVYCAGLVGAHTKLLCAALGWSKIQTTMIENNVAQQLKSGEVLMFYGPDNHVFLSWLNSQDRSMFRYNLVDYSALKPNVTIKMPYSNFQNQSLQTLLPLHYVSDTVVSILQVPKALMSWKQYDKRFPGLARNRIASTSHSIWERQQSYYEMFFPFYDELLTEYNIGTLASRKVPIELFTDRETRSLVNIAVTTPIIGLQVDEMVRNVYTRLKVPISRLNSQIGMHLLKGDICLLKNQEHRSIDGEYYITGVSATAGFWIFESAHRIYEKDYKTILAKPIGSNILSMKLKQLRTDDLVATAARRMLKPTHKCYFVQNQKGGTINGIDDKEYMIDVLMYDDIAIAEEKSACVSNPLLTTKSSCTSGFDHLGYEKPNGVDVWDKPCEYDNECPFFARGKNGSYRGGCLSGVCEMPIGVTQVGYRKYVRSEEDAASGAFEGDAFRQFAHLNS